MEWTFGTVLWSSLVFFFWFAVIWIYIAIIADIFRRHMSGWAKAGWIVVLVLLPFIGALIYLIAAPRMAPAPDHRPAWDSLDYRYGDRTTDYRPADAIARAAQLHDEGRITTDEYEALKRQALGR
jgi:hypothetical protein